MELQAVWVFQFGTFAFQLSADGAQEREGLEGFTEAHFVGEDAAELVPVEVPEPGGAEALIGAESGVEGRRDGRRREGGKIF